MNLMIRKCYIKILLNLNPPGIRRINYIQGVRGGMCQTSGGGSVPYVKVYRYNPKHLIQS